ncbi:MAG: RidA family protein [Anaerolineae bacterium]|nr:RidA family protein [Anaerolineae bacterium]
MREIISTTNAPAAVGAYSQAVKANGFVFTAGQLGIDPATGQFVPGGIEAQTEQALQNVVAILEAAGTSIGNAVKATVFLADMGDFKAMNGVYLQFVKDSPPARSAVAVKDLPLGGLVEIEMVAAVP